RFVMQARLASLLGREELALSWTGRALEEDARDAAAHHLRGRLMLARERATAGREEALAHLRSAVRAAPRVAGYHLTLGMELNRLGLATEAVKAASEAVSIHAGEPQLWMMLGDALTSSGDRSSAVSAYRKALDLNPQDPVVMNNLAFMLLELDRDLPLALELARRSVDAQQGYVYNLDTLAWALYKNGRANEALEVMLQIRESVATPTAEIEFHNAVICRELGLMESPRAVFLHLAERQDVDAVPGLRDRIISILETLSASETTPVRAGESGATGTGSLVGPASGAIAVPDGKGR
ncbi:MAG TPA: tetratricopeptide repeat protein, partial [Candidatus Ozemobacteraceae bacterium]|nr:tetratricopeptide repeat protein [Candidatus Ozemobacteraceae bacterium]